MRSRFAANYGTLVRQATGLCGAATIEKARPRAQSVIAAAQLPARWPAISLRGLVFTHRDDRDRTHPLNNVATDLVRGPGRRAGA